MALNQFSEVSDFDKITNTLFKKLISTNFTNPYYIKQDDFEDIDIDSRNIEILEDAIKLQNKVSIGCLVGEKEVEPYKITAYDGIWYLFGKDKDDNKIKTFMIRNLSDVKLLNKKYKTSQKQIEKILKNTHSAWYEDGQTFKVTIKVDKKISTYFKQKEFLQSQVIEDELKNGSLIVSFQVSHDEDIDNMIKSWLPHIEVLEPLRFRNKIKKELKEYLKKLG